jgi:hypothetical protein
MCHGMDEGVINFSFLSMAEGIGNQTYNIYD